MSQNDSPINRKRTPTPADTHPSRTLPSSQSRRRLLQTLTSTGALLLAGCGQDTASDGAKRTGTGTKQGGASSRMLEQTFRAPVGQNPAQTSFYQFAQDSAYDVTAKKRFSGRLKWIIRESGVWADKRWAGGNIHYTWLEDIVVTPTEITVKIRDDATWSDGKPITGPDIAVGLLSGYIRKEFPAYFATEKKDEPTIIRDAIDGFDITDKAVTYRSSPGFFDKWWDSSLKLVFGVGQHSGGSRAVPTHLEPYGDYAEAVFETARRAIQGEINPWKGWDDPYVQPDDPRKDTLRKKYLDKEGKYVAKFSNPENVVSTSIWNLVEINGPEAVLEPNPNHRNVENSNFKRLILEYTPGENRAWTALNADRLDYAAPGPTSQAVVESLPGTIKQLQIPGGPKTGNELQLNFNHPALGNRKVRLALMFALDQSTIANNIHQSAALPVTTPGGDCWDATDYVSEAWIDENLTTFEQDRGKAGSLMRAAGYTKAGGKWRNGDGEALTLPLPTPSTTPRWEPTVASQLSEFGIQTSVQTYEESTFNSRVSNGEFPMWAESGRLTSTADRPLVFWYLFSPG